MSFNNILTFVLIWIIIVVNVAEAIFHIILIVNLKKDNLRKAKCVKVGEETMLDIEGVGRRNIYITSSAVRSILEI